MAKSQNGWTANVPTLVSSRQVPGTQIKLRVRNGPAGDLLIMVAQLFDQLVQDIDTAKGAEMDDWGYAERPIRGATALSNHASGTAIDLNATRWSLGQSASVNLNPTQIAKVREIVKATSGVVRWGGDYSGRKDPMHFEINDNRTEDDCARALLELQSHFVYDEENELNADEKKMFAAMYRALTLPLGLDGRPGAKTDDMYGHVLDADATTRQILALLQSMDARLSRLEAKS